MDIDTFNANGEDPTLPSGQCDVTLVAENRRIFFNRLNLATHSSRFKRMIYGKHAIPKGGEILLKEGSKFDTVVAALNLLKLAPDFESVNCAIVIRQEEFITNSNVEDLLRFAEAYRLEQVTRFCEAFLTDVWGIFKPNKFTVIFMAFKYHLRGSLSQVIANMKPWLRHAFLSDTNLEPILSIASEFQMPEVVARCESYLLTFWKIEPDKIVHALELSAKFGLQNALGNLLKYGKHDAPPITDDDLEQILVLAKKHSIPAIASDCEQFILREWKSKGEKAVRAVEIARELNLPNVAIVFIPLAACRPLNELFGSTASGDILNPSYLKLLKRRCGYEFYHNLGTYLISTIRSRISRCFRLSTNMLASGLSAVEPQLVLSKAMTDLSNELLAQLFAYLPPTDRLHLSEVCSHFYDISREEWLDVVDLDLTPIPSVSIGAVLRQTPNVESISAKDRVLILDDLLNHSLISLTAMKLYGVTFASSAVVGHEKYSRLHRDLLCAHQHLTFYCPRLAGTVVEEQTVVRMGQMLSAYFENFPQLNELVLFDLRLSDISMQPLGSWMSFGLPLLCSSTLTRLVLHHGDGGDLEARLFCDTLASLRKLKCLSLSVPLTLEQPTFQYLDMISDAFCDALASLQELRELCMDGVAFISHLGDVIEPSEVGAAILRLPNLEMLFVDDVRLRTEDLAEIIEYHGSLRILLLAGVKNVDVYYRRQVYSAHGVELEKVVLPTRKRFPNGLDGDALPTLHIFVGRKVARYFSFTESASGASKVYPIKKSMPELLEEAEVAEIFAGSWLAEQIREGAEFEAELFGYSDAVVQSVSTIAADDAV